MVHNRQPVIRRLCAISPRHLEGPVTLGELAVIFFLESSTCHSLHDVPPPGQGNCASSQVVMQCRGIRFIV